MAAKFYEVGGSLRDELLGLPTKDRDYAVEAGSYSEMKDAILARGGEIFLETPAYYTIRARVPGIGPSDFVLCRKDGVYDDGRHPNTVEVGSIFEDLARRDFTCNAMARTEDGQLIDPFDGRDSCKHGYLKCVGRPELRFHEDGLRMLRAIRFAITKNMWMDASITRLLMDPAFVAEHLKNVSVERIREELLRCFQHNTLLTLRTLATHRYLAEYVFTKTNLWLKPTLESR